MSEVHVDAAGHAEPSFSTKTIWRTFWILLIITVVELVLAIVYYESHFLPKHFLNGLFVIGTLAKAFFIVAEFMHLGHEIRNLILTIAIPALLFVWFIIAFLWDGNSYKNLRNNYDRYHVEQSQKKVEQKEPEAKKPGAME
ncbi:MAG: cytochrome C oxidase subunit IV family protein [Bacteroidetes bacterium]|nr:cytochrome C oxidase subunit IV family protein [Bacteroidota bacterium]MBS1932567.1 cytochrome C oxidase subunit IV family protein [Bacteroidota bacterium]